MQNSLLLVNKVEADVENFKLTVTDHEEFIFPPYW